MITYRSYTDQALRTALLKLKENPKASDFPVIEQIEKEFRRRGKNPSNSYYGKDVIGSMIKHMKAQQTKVMSK